MNYKRLSLCMIAKNEAESIKRCIESVKGAVDEIVVVDTGSSDNTVEIASSLGAKVLTAEWEDDFSKARNMSLEQATGDWVLFLDCDEELAGDSLPELRDIIQTESAEAYFVKIINTTAEGIELTVPALRLFRNRSEYRFGGRIHEQIIGSIAQRCDRSQILYSNIIVHHFGYNQKLANIPAKIQRNMKILTSIPEEKRDGFYYYNLGTEYIRLGRKEEALASFARSASLTHPGQGYGPIMIKRMITLSLELGKYQQALNYLQYYRGIYREYNELMMLTGACHFMCGRYSIAREFIKKYLNMPETPNWYPVEKSYMSESPQKLLELASQHAIEASYPALSVCIIGNNERATLSTCIKSVNEIASQVVYIDTGSTDQSMAAASELGAQVHEMVWDNDFSSVRNYALGLARGEWVLMLNADEILPESSIKALIIAMNSKSSPTYLAKINTPLEPANFMQNTQVSSSVRLFRRNAYYRGSFAEELFYMGLKLRPEPIPNFEIIHLHFQASPQHIADKRKVYEQMIAAKWPDANPLKHFAMGQEAFYAKEIPTAFNNFHDSYQHGLRNESSLFYFYIISLTNIGKYEEAIKIAAEGQKVFPDYTDLFYLQGIALALNNQDKAAADVFLKCVEMGEAPWWKYLCNPGTGSHKALLSLGTIYVRQGKFNEAIDVFLQAARIPSSTEQAVEHLVMLHRHVNRPIDGFLSKEGLFNLSNIIVVARTLAKMGKRTECWQYLQILKEQSADHPELLAGMINIIETILFNITKVMKRYQPEHPIMNII